MSLIFGLGAVPGQPVEDFSLRTKLGMAKGLCIKAILLGAIECELTDDEVRELLPTFKSYFAVRCIFNPQGSEKQEKFGAMQSKMQEAARPRPDCFQGFNMFALQAILDGIQLEVAMDQYFEDFEGTDNQSKMWSELEKHIIRSLLSLSPEGRAAVAYHWDNYPAKWSSS